MFCLFLSVLLFPYLSESLLHPYIAFSAIVRKLAAPLHCPFCHCQKACRTPALPFLPVFSASNLWVLPLYDDYLRAMPRIWYDKCKDVWYLCKVLGDNLLWGWLGLLFSKHSALQAARSSDTSFVGYPVRRAPRSSGTSFVGHLVCQPPRPLGTPPEEGNFASGGVWRSVEEFGGVLLRISA